MTLQYRFYHSPRIGAGTVRDPYRAKICNYIVGQSDGTNYWDWINNSKPVRYGLAYCADTIHSLIDADAEIASISGRLSDLITLQSYLNGVNLLTPAIHNIIEDDSINLGWLASETTNRQLWRYICKSHVIGQGAKMLASSDVLALLGTSLSVQVNKVPVRIRNAATTWMGTKGLSSAWIDGTTTVRQVLHYIVENIDWPVLMLGPVSF
jgi:hypothetical protein